MHRRATIYVVRRLVQCGSDNRHRNDAPRMAFRHVSETFQRAKHEYNEKRCDKGENGKVAVARKGQYCVKNE